MTALGKLFRTTAFKLSLAYLAIFAIGSALVLARVASNVKTLIDDQIGQTIEAEITGLSEQYAQGGIRRLIAAIERRSRQPGSSLYLVTSFTGERIAGNVANLPAEVLSRPGIVETDYSREGDRDEVHRAMARIFLLPAGGFRLMVGRDVEERERLRPVMGRALIASLLWLVAIGTVGGLFVATRALKRVDAINASARSIMAGDLSGRLPVRGSGDELDRLAESLNAMIARIEELMAGLREVSDNIAHDLRTPLTRLRNGAEEALRRSGSPADYRAALEKTIDESAGLIRIFDALLMIARAEAGTADNAMQTIDACEIARGIAELYEPAAEEAGLALSVEARGALMVKGNRELVGQAVANLIDNAIKYGRGAGGVTVEVRRHAGLVEMIVADRGAGIPAADLGRVTGRFVRLEGARSRPGSGLGLSMAAAVARLHGGELRLADNAPGLRVVLALPETPLALPAPVARGDTVAALPSL